MILTRFLTDEEYSRFYEISTRKVLQSDNKGNYYHAENMRDDLDVIYINNVLKEVILDFSSFSNFGATQPNRLRVQYNWNAGTDDIYFKGVGFVTIDELRYGFDN